MSKPFPVGVEDAPPVLAPPPTSVARYAGEPLAVVVARDRYTAEDALELIDVEYEPLDPVLDAEHGEIVSDRSFSYGDPDAAFAAADLVVASASPFPRWTGLPGRVLRRRRGLERGERRAHRLGELPGPVHAAFGCGRRARPPGLEAAADHAAELGRQLRDQGDGLRLRRPDRPRLAQARRAGALDGGPARAPRWQLRVDRPHHRPRGGVRRRRRAARAALRRRSRTSARTSARRSRRASTGCTARSPAPTACGTSPRATASC